MHDPGGEPRAASGADPFADPELDAALGAQGPLSDRIAQRLIERGRARLDAGDHAPAIGDFQRVIGHRDANLTGAAILGTGDALYRLDQEDQARAQWAAVTQLPENESTYRAWRNLAGAHVREGELDKAIEAYRQADRRAPAEDKPEIAARLGWLAKETGNTGAASRYFARSRGAAGLGLAQLLVLATTAVSFAAFYVPGVMDALYLAPEGIESGELYRLVTVALVHAPGNSAPWFSLHLLLNMYALWVIGPIVEQIWGKRLFLLFYVVTAIGGSTASFVFSHAPAVGASGAIFGLVGVVLAGTRAHHPMLDRRARSIVPQLGMFVILNLIFGLVVNAGGLNIDIAAHVGGLLAGLWLGFVVPPGKAPTLRSAMQHPRGAQEVRSPLLIAAGVIGLLGVLAAALAAGGATL